MDELPVGSERVRVRRQPERGRYDRESVHAVLDAGLFAHVAFADDQGQPWCIPMLYARIGDRVYVHGSTGSRTMRRLAGGVPACLTVTLLDGVVLARSAFEHSANYRSIVLVGSFGPIDDADRVAAFEAFTNKLVPGRWDEVRPPNRKELAASWILAMPIGEASVKARSGPPSDGDSPDAALDTWAGVVPVASGYGTPQPAPELPPDTPLTPSVGRLLARDGAPFTSR